MNNQIKSYLKEETGSYLDDHTKTYLGITLMIAGLALLFFEYEIFKSIAVMVLIWVASVIVVLIYIAPTIVAFKRAHPNRWLIAALNLFGGVTGFIWVFMLIWAFRAVHISKIGSNGGESGLNIAANDELRAVVLRDKSSQLMELKSLLDSGHLTQQEYEALKGDVLRVESQLSRQSF